MKKNKIIGIGIATLGALISIGSAIALYTKAADETGFGIGAGDYSGKTGAITYKVNGSTSGSVMPTYHHPNGENGGTGLYYDHENSANSYNQIKYEFTLSATYANDLNPQYYIVGQVGISITNIPEVYRGHLSIWVSMEGYDDNTIGKTTYEHVFMTSDYAITSENTLFSVSKDVAVDTSGVQKVVVWLKFDNSDEVIGALAKDEAALGYSLNLTWGEHSSAFKAAYVVGNGNMWTKSNDYEMAPNIKSSAWQWTYNALPGSMVAAKCVKEVADQPDVWSSGSDAVLDSSKVYDVYWNGEASGEANFADR